MPGPASGDPKLVTPSRSAPGELFPVLSRAHATPPLILVLAVLPGLYAIGHHQLTDTGALWALKSLSVLTDSAGGGTIVDPLQAQPSLPKQWQAPLSTWLMAAVMRLLGPSHPAGPVLVSYVATAGLVWMTFLLGRLLIGARFAFWTVVLLCCHALLLEMAHNPAPYALTIACAVTTFWGFLSYVKSTTTAPATWPLLTAGAALGICLLAGGPVAAGLTFITLLLHVLGLGAERINIRRRKSPARKRVWIGRPALKSLVLLTAIGLAVGGWWPVMMSIRYGGAFWIGSLSETGAVEVGATAYDLLRFPGLLAGFIGLGVWHALQRILQSSEATMRRWPTFFLGWLGSGLLAVVVLETVPAPDPYLLRLCRHFLLVPGLALAAVGIDQIDKRNVRIEVGAALAGLPLLFPLWLLMDPAPFTARIPVAAWLPAILLLVCGGAWWWMRRRLINRALRERFVLSVLVLGLVIANGWLGLETLPSANGDTRALTVLKRELATISKVETIVLIADELPPSRLQYTLRSLRPDASFHICADRNSALDRLRSATRPALLVNWGAGELRLAEPPQDTSPIDEQPPLLRFEGKQLRSYVIGPGRIPLSGMSEDAMRAHAPQVSGLAR